MIDALRGTLRRAQTRCAEPLDGAWLVALRVLLGGALCISMLRFIVYGWIDGFFIEPAFHFKYWGFHWVQPLPRGAMHALFHLLAALSACVALGLWFRWTAWAFVLGFAYLQLIDVTTYLNHYYLALLLMALLALSPAGKLASVDAWRRNKPLDGAVSAGWLYLFRFQVAVVYGFAGLAKAQPDWLLHAQPLSIWLGSKTDLPILGPVFQHAWAPWAFSWAGFLFDTTIAGWLLWRPTRPFAYAAVLLFHAVTRLLFPIGMFPVIMVLAALVFFEPDWPRALLRMRRPRPRVEPRPSALMPARRRAVTALVAAYCALSIALPLRHWAYSGSVLWHEQGMRWSWRVMVREKNGAITFHVRDASSGRHWQVAPRRYLTRLQEREMSGQPDLILQLAHHIRDEYARLGHDVEVRAEALVSLNGRRARPLIDPNVDLTRIDDSVARAHWITPSPPEPPPHIRPI